MFCMSLDGNKYIKGVTKEAISVGYLVKSFSKSVYIFKYRNSLSKDSRKEHQSLMLIANL